MNISKRGTHIKRTAVLVVHFRVKKVVLIPLKVFNLKVYGTSFYGTLYGKKIGQETMHCFTIIGTS